MTTNWTSFGDGATLGTLLVVSLKGQGIGYDTAADRAELRVRRMIAMYGCEAKTNLAANTHEDPQLYDLERIGVGMLEIGLSKQA